MCNSDVHKIKFTIYFDVKNFLSIAFSGMVDGVLWDFDHQVLVRHNGLTAQARLGLQTPSAVQQVILALVSGGQRRKPLSHNDVASGASTAHLAGMFKRNVMRQQSLADRCAGSDIKVSPLGATGGMGQKGDRGHGVELH